MEIILVDVKSIRPSPINKCAGARRDIGELSESIRIQGMINEPLVREMYDESGNYFELLCGERRWLAVSTFSDTISVKNVGVITDSEAHEITVTENLQRKDISPLEEAALIRLLITDGLTPEAISQKLGKSIQWVARRSKLTNLAECFVEAFCDPKHKLQIHRWSTAHLEIISRFELHIQQGIFNNLIDECNGFYNSPGMLTVDDVKAKLDSYLLRLSTAPWKLNDNKTFDFACTDCQKRSACQTDLFDQLTEKNKPVDQCLDRDCWNHKLKIHIEIKESEDDSIDVVIDNNAKRSGMFEEGNRLKDIAIPGYQTIECKKSDPGAKKALIIDGPDAGKTKYVRLTDAYEKKISGVGKTLEEKREGLDKRRRKEVCQRVMNIFISEQKEPRLIKLLIDSAKIAISIIFGCRQLQNVLDDTDYDDFDIVKNYYMYTKHTEFDEMLTDAVRCALPVLHANVKAIQESDRIELDNCKRFSDLIGIDLDEIIRAVQLDIEEPVSWTKSKSKSVSEESLIDTPEAESEDNEPVSKLSGKIVKSKKIKTTGKTKRVKK